MADYNFMIENTGTNTNPNWVPVMYAGSRPWVTIRYQGPKNWTAKAFRVFQVAPDHKPGGIWYNATAKQVHDDIMASQDTTDFDAWTTATTGAMEVTRLRKPINNGTLSP